jgi:carboxyl-terminal processing protease
VKLFSVQSPRALPTLFFSSISCRLIVTALFFGLLTSCGGGGGSSGGSNNAFNPPGVSSGSTWKSGVFLDSASYANKCVVPRTGTNPSTNKVYLDQMGKVSDEKNFLRSWSNETYLWYSEIFDTDPQNTANVLAYFGLLKTTAKTASGNNKDNFHFTYGSSEWYSLSETGVSAGYGVELSWVSGTAPRNVVVAYTEPGSPAANANLLRGAKLIKIDGYDFVNATDTPTVDKLNAAIYPKTLGEVHTFEVQDLGASTTHSLVLQSSSITKTPVQNVKVLDTPTGKVGYILFNDHIKTAERGLYDAINQLGTQGVKDLVLDVRYNGGGYLYIASELAFMIAGSTATAGKTFEKTVFNDKHTTTDIFGETLTPTPFYGGSNDIGGSFPSLNLARVFVITSGDTCSASEAIINGLRGVGVEVIQIGSKTCGKPYGFYPQDNCGTTYFSIQFKGVNNKGFGEYSDGFVPSATDNGMDLVKGCNLGDDLSHSLGDQAEKNLATALNYRATGSCILATGSAGAKLQKTQQGDDLSNISGSLHKAPGLTNRIMK